MLRARNGLVTAPLWFALIVGFIALAALVGWTYTNIRLSTSLLPMANALKVCQLIVKQEDDKVASLAERVLRKREPQKAPAETNRRPDGEPANPLLGVFGGAVPAYAIDEQPDSEGLEIVGS